MRNMSFFLTTQQMRDEEKDVTRRLGWKFLKAGDMVMACVKCQGLGKGGKIERIHPIEIVRVDEEPLSDIMVYPCRDGFKLYESAREGFPDLTETGFIRMFMKEMKCDMDIPVNRIEFKHRTDLGGSCCVCGNFILGYEPKMCCSSIGCGCRGMPTNPPICSEECWDKGLNS